ncbi:MAG: outer membrane protein [Verrucomicrobiota bacterium]
MKLILKRFVPVLVLLGLFSTSALAQTRIATVDLRKLFENYYKTKIADTALKDRAAEMDKSHVELLDGWKKAKDEYQKLLASANDQAVSSEEKDKRKKAAEDKLKEIKDTEDNITQFERQARTTLDEQRRRMRDNILVEINAVLKAKAKTGGYTMVIDTAAQTANETPVVLYSVPGDNDLTEFLLSQLNAGAPVETPKASETKPAEKAPVKK